ncbi:MAG: twin-arginine translocase TatA/TatE family subunit [Acidobacteriia bacterium]|nr:twin-arginine translocase TatA/TatE family subunit [Terriglobia bacterium]
METSMAGIGMPGTQELLVILLIVALLFGTSRIPALGRSLGEGLGHLRRGLKELTDDQPKDHEHHS